MRDWAFPLPKYDATEIICEWGEKPVVQQIHVNFPSLVIKLDFGGRACFCEIHVEGFRGKKDLMLRLILDGSDFT